MEVDHEGSRNVLRASAALLLLAFGCGGDRETGGQAPPAPEEGFCKVSAAQVEVRIDALLPQMTLAEKVEQMHRSRQRTKGPGASTRPLSLDASPAADGYYARPKHRS